MSSLTITRCAELRIACKHESNAGEPEEKRGCQAAKNIEVAKDWCRPAGQTGPRIERVRFDHHQDSDSARPIDVRTPHGVILQALGFGLRGYRRPWGFR